MLEKIEDINLLNLAKDIKEMISDGKLKIKTDDYQVELEVNNDFKELKALKRLLEIMVHENFLMTELYFENKDDFKKCFNDEYSSKLNEIFHIVRVKEIKVQGEDSYM